MSQGAAGEKPEDAGGREKGTDVKGWVLLAALAVYVILLGIGTIAEAFDIQWILDWPIY